MKSFRLAAIVAAMALAPVVLAACGSSGNSDDEKQISAAIDAAATSGEASACTEVQTQKFTEQTSGGTGADAVKSCEKDAADSASDTVEVSNIEVDGDTATAEATFGGGFIDGQTLTIDLVKDGDAWKLDELTGFVDFDRDSFIASSIAAVGEDPSTPAEATACLQEQFGAASDQDLQNLVLVAESGQELFGPCFGGE